MSNIQARIEAAKANLEKGKQQRIVAETNKATYEKQRADVEAQMSTEGVTPETIGQEIAQLEVMLDSELTRVEQMLPKL